MAADCEHKNFVVDATIGRLTEGKSGPVTNYMCYIRVTCSDCGELFKFLGLPKGLNVQGAMVSADGVEARLAIEPDGTHKH